MDEVAALEKQEDRLRVGARVIEARERRGFSQRELARRLVERRGKHDPGSASFEKAVTSMQRTLRRTENGHNMPQGDLLLAIAELTGAESGHFTTERPHENEELRRRAKEMIAPFQHRNGRRAAGRMPSARRRTSGGR